MDLCRLKFFLNLALLLCLISPAFAQESAPDWDSTEQNVFIRIFQDKGVIQGGEDVSLVIKQIIRPHWHTYWRNAGDSGEPMRSNWSLPDGFSLSEIKWPTPLKLPFDPLVNYGYEKEALLTQTLTIPSDIPDGAIHIPVRFDILVCKEICIPESVEKVLSFNDGKLNEDEAGPEFFADAQNAIPHTDDKHGWKGQLSENNGNLILSLETPKTAEQLQDYEFEFFPYEYGLVDNAAVPSTIIDGNRVIFQQARGDFQLDRIKDFSGVLAIQEKSTTSRFGYEITPKRVDSIAVPASEHTDHNAEDASLNVTEAESVSLISALLFAIIGGVILNLMPCVFPVLSMKVLSLSKISQKSRSEAQSHGLAYTAGIILSFIAIAALLIILKTGGSEVGWGFHLQNPVVILLLSYLFFAVGLNLAGFFEIGGRLMSIGQGQKTEGVKGSFMTGILATIVATPCTAPFMAVALGYALIQPAYISLLIFAALGLGLALPYLIISFVPALQKLMPRPGVWMVTFKEFLAFPMFATTIWLLWILSNQIGMNGVAMPLIGLLGIAFAIWIFNHAGQTNGLKKTILIILSLVMLGGSLFGTIFEVQTYEMSKDKPMPEFGAPYSENALEDALKTDNPVFVEMTAAWCVTCKVNHYRAIDIEQTREIMALKDIVYLIGDWTNYDAEITKYLNKFGRNGVPIYIYYGRPDAKTGERPAPEMLPQILSPDIIAQALNK